MAPKVETPAEPNTLALDTDDHVDAIMRQLDDKVEVALEGHARTEVVTAVTERVKALESLVAANASSRKVVDETPRISMRNLFQGLRRSKERGFDRGFEEFGHERELIQETEARARLQSSETDDTGGYLVGIEYMPELFVDFLRASQITTALGAIRLNFTRPVEIPVGETGVTVYMLGENAQGTVSTATFGNLSLRPHKMMALARVPNELLKMSDPSVEAYLNRDAGEAIGLKTDDQVLEGDGVGPNVLGLVNTSGIGAATFATFATAKGLHQNTNNMVYTVENGNAALGNLGWAQDVRTWAAMRSIVDGDGRPLLGGTVAGGVTKQLQGHKVETTTQLTAGTAIFGNWSDLVIAMYGPMQFALSTSADGAFRRDQTMFRMILAVDAALRHKASFVKNTSITETP